MGWIGVDLDGTLAYYESGQYPEIGKPIPRMLERVQGWMQEGKEVRIMTARAAHGPEVIKQVKLWLEEHGLSELQVTCMKDSEMDELWDDKAIQVKPNTGEPIVDQALQESYAHTIQWRDPKNKRGKISDPNTFELMSSIEKASKVSKGDTEDWADMQGEAFALMKGLEKDRREE